MLGKGMLLAGTGALALLSVTSPATAQAPRAGVRIEHAAARVVLIPEARGNVSVTVQAGDPRLPRPEVHTEGGVVVVDGGLERRIGGCGGFGFVLGSGPHRDSTMRVMIRGIGPLTLERLPVITAHVPLDTAVKAEGAVWGEVGPTSSLEFANVGCGDWTLADVRGPLSVAQSGSGDVRGGSAAGTRVAVSGSGDITLRDVGALEVSIAGSGDVRVRRAEGPLSARIAGSGDLTVESGHAPNVAASIAGSGDFRFGGEAGAVAARIAGSGDVHVARASGPVSRSVIGSGDVVVGR